MPLVCLRNNVISLSVTHWVNDRSLFLHKLSVGAPSLTKKTQYSIINTIQCLVLVGPILINIFEKILNVTFVITNSALFRPVTKVYHEEMLTKTYSTTVKYSIFNLSILKNTNIYTYIYIHICIHKYTYEYVHNNSAKIRIVPYSH